LIFDYRYDNGTINLMQRLNLIYEDDRSWDVAHSVAWSFAQVADARDLADPERPRQFVALVRARPLDAELRRQLGFLGELGVVVDVGREERAARSLADLLHIPPSALRIDG